MRKILLTALLLVFSVGCSKVEFMSTIPYRISTDYYISLSGGTLYLGQEMPDTSAYVQDEEDSTRFIQSLGLFDIKVDGGILTEIRTGSTEIKLSSTLYVGQTQKSLESYLVDTVKYEFSDRVVYYDVLNEVGVEVIYNKDSQVEVLRLKTMRVVE